MNKIIEYKAPNIEIYLPERKYVKIFLAGSIEMGTAEDWQYQVVESLKHRLKLLPIDFEVYIFNPRRNDWDSTWKQEAINPQFAQQVEWEIEHIEKSDIVAFHFQPGTLSPISLYELGLVSRESFRIEKRVIVHCPEGYFRKGNVDIYTQYYDMVECTSFEHFVDQIEQAIYDHQHSLYLDK